jgi:hypothetical protein
MRMFKYYKHVPGIWLRTNKKIKYETIDFDFNPKHMYKLKVIEKTKFLIPNIPYDKQYESRDF